MTRLVVVIVFVLGVTNAARGDTELAVLGPAEVMQPLARAGFATPTEIAPACVLDLACVTAAGGGARRVLALALTPRGKQVTVTLVLVDAVAKEQLGKRDVAIAAARLARDLAPAVRRFLDEAPTERAKALFADGNRHYQLGELAPALERYRRAYQVKPLAELLFNIAQCHRKLGQHRDAITMYQSYLVGVPDAANKPLVDELIAESKAALAIAEQREADRLAAGRAEELRKAREAEAVAAAERRRAEQARSQRRVVPWLAIGIGAAAVIGGSLLYATSETDDGSQPTYRDSRPAGIGVAIGGIALAGTGVLWVARF